MSDTNGTPEAPALAEVVVEVRNVEFDGESFSFSADLLDDVEVMEAWEDGKHTTLLRHLLGPDQWAKFKKKKRPVVDIYNLLNAILEDEK